MTEVGYTKTIKPVRDWNERLWRLMFTQQLEITRGRVEGSYPVVIDGHLTTSGAATDVLVLDDSAIKDPSVAPAAGLQMSIVSTSAQDGPGGTGVRTIRFNYLDADLIEREEIVTLNGTTPVLTAATNIRWVGEIHMLTYGSGKAFAGDVTVTNAGTRYKFIPAGNRTTRSSAYRVADAGLLFAQGSIGLQDGSAILSDGALYAVPAGEIIALRATTDKGATITGGFFGWLEDAD
jgi:hypothetical protein